MPAERFPRAIWKGDGYSTGSYTGGPWKCVLHTTETAGVPSYNDGRSTPHVTYFPRERKFYQHLNFSQPARALRDAEGGVATNRDSVIQLEIVAYSQESVVDQYPNTGRVKVSELSEEQLADIREFCRFVADEFGIEWTYPTSNARWSVSAYDKYGGFLGHKHVPENTHWDPGALNFQALFIEEIDLTYDEVVAAVREALEIRERADHSGIVYRHSDVVSPSVWNIAFGKGDRARYPSSFIVNTEIYAKAAASRTIDIELDQTDIDAIAAGLAEDLGAEVARAVGEKLVA